MPGILDSIFGTQPQPQQPPLPASLQPPLGGRVGAGLMGFLNAGSLPEALGNLIGGVATGQRLDPRGIQQQFLMDQYQDWSKTHPNGDINQFLFDISQPGLQQKYGVNFGPPVEAGSAKAPIQYGQGQPPHLFNVGASTPSAGQQAQPSQQPASAIDNLADTATNVERKIAAAKARGEEEGAAQTTVEGTVGAIDRSMKLIDEIAADPGLKWVTGGFFGSIPPMPGMPGYSAALKIEQLKQQLTLDVLPSLQRKGSRVAPALTELLQKSTAGQELDRASGTFLKSLHDTRDTLGQIRTASQGQANVPVTQAPQAPNTFNTAAELRAAIKAGKIKVGEPFMTGDGRNLIAQ